MTADIKNKFYKEIYQKLGSSRCVTINVFINNKCIELNGVFDIDELKYITELSEKYLKDLEDASKTENKSKECNICEGNKYYVTFDGYYNRYYNPCGKCNPNGKAH
jgi:hypothetical protein